MIVLKLIIQVNWMSIPVLFAVTDTNGFQGDQTNVSMVFGVTKPIYQLRFTHSCCGAGLSRPVEGNGCGSQRNDAAVDEGPRNSNNYDEASCYGSSHGHADQPRQRNEVHARPRYFQADAEDDGAEPPDGQR